MPNYPKPQNRRSRQRPGPEFRELEIVPSAQPDLPPRDRPWSAATLRFWERLGESSIAPELTATEWDLLALAAAAYEEMWTENKLTRIDGFMSIMGRFPFTPRDRLALRVQALTGVQMEQRVREGVDRAHEKQKLRARASYEGLRTTGGGQSA